MTARYGRFFVIAIAVCSSLFIIVRGCQNQSVDNPVLQLTWPASYSEFSQQMPIGISSWSGVLKTSIQSVPEENGRFRVGIYSLKDTKNKCHGSATCIIDASRVSEVCVVIGTDLPIHENVTPGMDYSVLRATNIVEGWAVFTASKKPREKDQH